MAKSECSRSCKNAFILNVFQILHYIQYLVTRSFIDDLPDAFGSDESVKAVVEHQRRITVSVVRYYVFLTHKK